jgi:hypothetical protein
MSIKRIDVGARMSGAVVHGNTVYLAGQVGEGESVTEQCKSALAEVDRLLAAAGSNKSKVLQTPIRPTRRLALPAKPSLLHRSTRSSSRLPPPSTKSRRCCNLEGRWVLLTGFLFGRFPKAYVSA